jgi:hypothetical protein
MNSLKITVAELKEHLGKLDDRVKIIMVESESQIPVFLLKHAETLTLGQRVYKFLRNKVGAIVAVWIFMLTMFPEITPTPLQAFKTVNQEVVTVVKQVDFSFPYPLPDPDKPWILFPDTLPTGAKQEGANYYISGSGIAPSALT